MKRAAGPAMPWYTVKGSGPGRGSLRARSFRKSAKGAMTRFKFDPYQAVRLPRKTVSEARSETTRPGAECVMFSRVSAPSCS